jgi:ribosomal protein S18 acetylase RimI-like enzyme
MDYRLYKPEDFGALYAIEEICFQRPFRFARRYMLRLVEARTAATWIAEEDGRMAGFAIAEWMTESRGVNAYIPTVEVTPDYRGRGVGGELLRRIEGSAHEAGARMIWLHVDATNAGAIKLYESHGYGYFDREEDFYAPGRGALIYRKALVKETAQ